MYCNIIICKPFDKVFTYEAEENSVKIGQVVIVPFAKNFEVGIVWEINVKKPSYNIKRINKIINNLVLEKSILNFIRWVNQYTLAPIGMVLKLFLINKEIVNYKNYTPINNEYKIKYVKLNGQQLKAKINIKNFLSSNKPIVLEGVTGSGKTEVYFDLIEDQIKKNNQVLIMVPEISLTPQLSKRFNERFGVNVNEWHSKISSKKKKDIWHHAYSGLPLIVIGARSSLFIPFTRLGMIIIDEEHDSSYKQEDNIRYQARDLAVVRAKIQKCGLILSSATPSMETINNVYMNKYHHVYLSHQYSGLPLPNVELIDLTKNKLENNKWISQSMKIELTKCLDRKEQALIFLNRRGFSPLILCSDCGFRYQCNQCTSWLVMHKKNMRLLCHQCGSIQELKEECPKCLKKNSIKFVGPGVERVAEELHSIYPSKKIAIMSSDIVNSSKKVKDLIDKFLNKKIDIVVATQIMAKGYDFPNLSFVGVVDADAGLFGSDMRAMEKTYNLLQQVSGRAGRSKKPGKVMIQTHYPEESIIQSIQKRDRDFFISQALKERKQFNLPPFGYITSIIISGSSKSNVEQISLNLTRVKPDIDVVILGPVEAPIALLRGQYRYRILLKGKNRQKLNVFTKKIIDLVKIPSSIKVIIDVDPYSFM